MPRSPSSRTWRDPPTGTGTSDAMNPDQMIDYALGRLDGHEREHVEQGLRADPAAEARADRLETCLALLLDDGLGTLDPPPGLGRRTLALVAETRSRPRSLIEYVP